jgi:nucleoside-triphosphatase THEP1
MKSIFIISGPVHSGKTTRLLSWLQNKINLYGILSPVIDGKRYLLNIDSNEKRMLEVSGKRNQKDSITVGKYKFAKSVFEWGCEVIANSIAENPEWIVIDEVGPLELQGEGLAKAVNKVFSHQNILVRTNLVLVVRDYLMTDFLNHYNLTEKDINFLNVVD